MKVNESNKRFELKNGQNKIYEIIIRTHNFIITIATINLNAYFKAVRRMCSSAKLEALENL